MHPEVKSAVLTQAHKLTLVGGIAAVLSALWWLVPAPPPVPPPMGRLEQAYREEIIGLSGESASSKCQYWPKHLYLSCGAMYINATELLSRGWRLEPMSGEGRWYARQQWRMKLKCAPLATQSCEVEIRQAKD